MRPGHPAIHHWDGGGRCWGWLGSNGVICVGVEGLVGGGGTRGGGVGVVVGAGGWGAVLGGSEGAALVLCARLLLKEAVDGFSLSMVYVVSLGC